MGMGGISIWGLIFIFVIIPIAFLPTIIAFRKSHKHKIPILLVNIFGGLVYGIGWLVALIWCFWPSDESVSESDLDKLTKLKELSEKGVITLEEFEEQKSRILKSMGDGIVTSEELEEQKPQTVKPVPKYEWADKNSVGKVEQNFYGLNYLVSLRISIL